jgi:hypothetical protein
MALEKGTVLVAKNYIKCYVPSYQFEVGTEFVYLFSYQGCYMVQRSCNGKVYDSGNLMPEHSGEAGCLLAVKPCDVEVKKENKKSKSAKTTKTKTIKELPPQPQNPIENRMREIVRDEVMKHLKVNLSIWSEGGSSADIEWSNKIIRR